MSAIERALSLLKRANRTRAICSQVAEETGGLLHDDWCRLEALEAEAALDARDRAHGYEPARRNDVEQHGKIYGRNARAVRR